MQRADERGLGCYLKKIGIVFILRIRGKRQKKTKRDLLYKEGTILEFRFRASTALKFSIKNLSSSI